LFSATSKAAMALPRASLAWEKKKKIVRRRTVGGGDETRNESV